MFTLISDMNVASRVDSYLTNMKLPWEKDLPPVIVSVGAVECYIQDNINEFKFDRVWTKTFSCQVILKIKNCDIFQNRLYAAIGINRLALYLWGNFPLQTPPPLFFFFYI